MDTLSELAGKVARLERQVTDYAVMITDMARVLTDTETVLCGGLGTSDYPPRLVRHDWSHLPQLAAEAVAAAVAVDCPSCGASIRDRMSD